MALDHQEKSHLIIKAIVPEDSQYMKQSQHQLNQFMTLSVQQEKEKRSQKDGMGARAIGENAPKLTVK